MLLDMTISITIIGYVEKSEMLKYSQYGFVKDKTFFVRYIYIFDEIIDG